MDSIQNILKLVEIHQLILKNSTGSLDTMSKTLHLPKMTLKHKLDKLTSLGAKIKFDKIYNTYYYQNNFKFEVTITYSEDEDEK